MMMSTRGGSSSRSTTADASSQSSSVLTGSDGGNRSASAVKERVKAAKEAAMVAAMEAFQAHVMDFNEDEDVEHEAMAEAMAQEFQGGEVVDDEENLLYASAREFEISQRDVMASVNVSDFTIDWDVDRQSDDDGKSRSILSPPRQERQKNFLNQQQQLQQQRQHLQEQRQQLEQQLQLQERQRQQLLQSHLRQQNQQNEARMLPNFHNDDPPDHHYGPKRSKCHEDPPEQQQPNANLSLDQSETFLELEKRLKKELWSDLKASMGAEFDATSQAMEESIKQDLLVTLRNEFNQQIQIEVSKMRMELWNKMLIEINKKTSASGIVSTPVSGSRRGSAGKRVAGRRGSSGTLKGLNQLQLPLSPGKSALSTVSEEFKEDDDSSSNNGNNNDADISGGLTKRESALVDSVREEIMTYLQIELDNRESLWQKQGSSGSIQGRNLRKKRSSSATDASEGGGIFTASLAAFDMSYMEGDDDTTNHSGEDSISDSDEEDEQSEMMVNIKGTRSSKLYDNDKGNATGLPSGGDDKNNDDNNKQDPDKIEDGKEGDQKKKGRRHPGRLRRRRKREKKVKVKPTEAELQQTLPKDVYSLLIASRIFSWPFLVGATVSIMQVLLLFLLARDQWNDGNKLNPIGLPVNVGRVVRTTQVLAILISVFVQDDLRIALNYMNEGYVNLDNLRNSSPMKWWFAMILRSFLGSFGLFVAFLLIVESDNVFDLLLNFTGVAFIR